MAVLLTFTARTCHRHFWNVSVLLFAFQPQHLLWLTAREGIKTHKSRTQRWILLCVEIKWVSVSWGCTVTHPDCFASDWWSCCRFSSTTFCTDLNPLINRGAFICYRENRWLWLLVSAHRTGRSMCFRFGMLHLPTHTRSGFWEGRGGYFWLRRNSKHLHPPPAQLFREIPQQGPCAVLTPFQGQAFCSDAYKANWYKFY